MTMRGQPETELHLHKAASCWLAGEMQVEVDLLCLCISQRPNSLFWEGILAPVSHATKDPQASVVTHH